MSKIKMPKGLVSVRATSWFLDIVGFPCPQQKWWPLGCWASCKVPKLIMKSPLSWPIYLPNTPPPNSFTLGICFSGTGTLKMSQHSNHSRARPSPNKEPMTLRGPAQEVEMDQSPGRKSLWPHTRIFPLPVLYGVPKGMVGAAWAWATPEKYKRSYNLFQHFNL